MAQAGPPPVSDDGLWYWDGTQWKSLVSADRQKFWNGTAWVPLPPSASIYQPPVGPPPGLATEPRRPLGTAAPSPQAAPPAPPPTAAPPPPPLSAALPSPPGYLPPSAPSAGPPPASPTPPPPQEPVEPRPAWLPADAPWPPATFSATTSAPLTTDATLPAPAPGAVPWANVYSDVMTQAAGRGHALAGFGVRLIAYLIDSLILGVPFLVVYFLYIRSINGVPQDIVAARAVTNVFNLIGTLLSLAYFVYFWSSGSTPGMKVFGIRVADASTYKRIGLGRAFLRYVGFVVASGCCLIGLIWAAFDSRKQGWHDKIGGTVVIYR